MAAPIIKWVHPSNGQSGIVTGCDSSHEWMLPWWWFNYHKHNRHPLLIADFGMSARMRKWCSGIAEVASIDFPMRLNWFKKPSAILLAKFERIIWLDTDCEIRGPLDPLFEYATGMAAVPDPFNRWAKGSFNSGVIVAKHGEPLVESWAAECLNTAERGDQEALAALLARSKAIVTTLPQQYNRLRIAGDDPTALVMHWTGPMGKQHIKNLVQHAGHKIP